MPGGRDAASYVGDGSCGVDALAAALGIDACAYEDECAALPDEACAAHWCTDGLASPLLSTMHEALT